MNIIKRFKRPTLGEIKMWQSRLATYVSMINFILLFYLFITENKWFEWYIWFFVITSVVLFIVIFDTIKVMPDQLGYGFRKNPEWLKHKRNQKRIMEKLGIGDLYE